MLISSDVGQVRRVSDKAGLSRCGACGKNYSAEAWQYVTNYLDLLVNEPNKGYSKTGEHDAKKGNKSVGLFYSGPKKWEGPSLDNG